MPKVKKLCCVEKPNNYYFLFLIIKIGNEKKCPIRVNVGFGY